MIIGLAGKMGSGKDTVAGIIQKHWPHCRFERKGLADKLKEVEAIVTGLGLAVEQRDKDRYLPEFKRTRREMLQVIGDGMREMVHRDVWVMALLRSYEVNAMWVVSDVRYLSEIIALEGLDARVYRVIRPKVDRRGSEHGHASEVALDQYDLPEILNDGTIEDLERRVIETFTPLLGPPVKIYLWNAAEGSLSIDGVPTSVPGVDERHDDSGS